MSKQKKKQKGAAEKVIKSKSQTSKQTNPFEVRINKQKHQVIGQRTKCDKGFPGVSRNKAFKKRKALLQLELKKERVSNLFLDKRLGEKNDDLDEEDRRLARYAAQKQRAHSKNIFNLDDTEELTHLGRSLQEIEKYDDPRSDDEEEPGPLESNYVKDVHFGGFLTKKPNSTNEADNKPKSRKEWLEFMINQTRMKKVEKMKAKDETLSLTEKVDSEWRERMTAMAGLTRKATDESQNKQPEIKRHSYDKLIKELIFQPRAKATDRLLSEEEEAKKEKVRLDKLEEERMKRMEGGDVNSQIHRSADDLPAHAEDYSQLESRQSDSDETSSAEEDSDDDVESQKNQEMVFKNKNDNLSAKESELSFTYEVPSSYEEFVSMCWGQSAERHSGILNTMIKRSHPSLAQENKSKLEKLYLHLLHYVNHIGLKLSDLDTKKNELLEVFESLVPHIYSLTHLLKGSAARAFKKMIRKNIEDYRAITDRKRTYPKLDTVLLLSLMPALFPTSDFRHAVCTPAIIFILSILCSCRPTCKRHLCMILFLLTLLYQCVLLSKRYSGEVIVFLEGLLHTAIPKKREETRPVLPPFKAVGVATNILTVTSDCRLKERAVLRLSDAAMDGDLDNVYRLTVIEELLKLLQRFIDLYKEYPASSVLFNRFPDILSRLPKKRYPEQLRAVLSQTKSKLENLPKNNLTYLSREKQRPKALRLFEPKFEMQFDGRKHWGNMGEKKRERKRLQHQYKKEMKGAIREVRKDTQVLQGIKQQQQKLKDMDRKRKVKALMASLGQQEGDYRAIVKMKKK